MRAIILLGAPGAGKGTVAETLKAQTPYVHVSTGDMLREAIASGSPVGLEAKAFMDQGELVPDAVVLRIVRDRIKDGGVGAKWMFDGFPRTLAQAQALDDVLKQVRGTLYAVYVLDVPREVLVRRLADRRVCRSCGAVYNLTTMATKVPGRCDRCGGEVVQRPDDDEATVINRLEVYARQTEDLIAWYDRRGVLVRIPAAGSREDTDRAILAHLAAG